MISIDSLAAYALCSDDPFFYEAKERLREAFPAAIMIELAENTVTIVSDNGTTLIMSLLFAEKDQSKVENSQQVPENTGLTH